MWTLTVEESVNLLGYLYKNQLIIKEKKPREKGLLSDNI